MPNKSETFVVFKTVLDSAKCLDDNLRNELCYVVLEYGFSGELVECNPIIKAVMLSIIPNIDVSKTKYKTSVENGKKGGRPKTQEKPNPNPTLTQEKPNPNLDKDKDKDKDKDIKEEEGEWNFINRVKLEYCGVKFTVEKIEYYFGDDGKLRTWNTNRAVTAPKAMMLYKRMNENQDAVLYHLNHNKKKD